MDSAQVLEIISVIFKDVLDNDGITIGMATTARDIEEWDSLSHIQLVVAIEKRFKVRFTTPEIQKWKCVGDMVQDLQKKLG